MNKCLSKKYECCPKCGHDWIAHFQMIEDNGTSIGKLINPKPRPCMECQGSSGCQLAIEEREK